MGFIWIKVFYYFDNIGSSVLVVCRYSVAGILLALSIRVHFLANKLLNSSALSLKFEMNLILQNRGGIQGNFY